MNRIPRPSAAMVVAMVALIVAIGGTAAALPGKFTVGRDDLKTSSVGARALGRMIVGHIQVVQSLDPVAGDGNFTETRGSVRCPSKASTAIDPSVANLGSKAFAVRSAAIPNQWGAPLGYEFILSTDEGPNVGYALTVNCLLSR